MNQLQQLPHALMQLQADFINPDFPVYSLWCSRGAQQIKPSLRAYHGLPPSARFAAFLVDPEISHDKGSDVLIDTSLGWRSCARTTVGKRRQINEDAYLERSDIGLWAVADGMGGHWAGDVASKAAVDALDALTGSDQLPTWIDDVTTCLHRINEGLVTMAHHKGDGQIMGTTVVSMLAVGQLCAASWAGDSRLYRCREGILSQLTTDHSLLAELAQQQDAPPDEVAGMAYGNVVTRALGADAELLLDTITYEAKPGDIYLLCSDGLVKEVNNQEIATVLSRGTCQESSQALLDLALERGARDNVTVIVIHAPR
jgi:serine/threonine protein phosphatase PrpC